MNLDSNNLMIDLKQNILLLYYKMLNETISELKNEKKVDSDWSPSINLGFSFNIGINNFDKYIIKTFKSLLNLRLYKVSFQSFL